MITIRIRFDLRFDCNSKALRSFDDPLLHCGLHKQIGQRDCGQRVSGPCYVTVTLMTFDKQSNARGMPVEWKSNRSHNHRLTARCLAAAPVHRPHTTMPRHLVAATTTTTRRHRVMGAAAVVPRSMYVYISEPANRRRRSAPFDRVRWTRITRLAARRYGSDTNINQPEHRRPSSVNCAHRKPVSRDGKRRIEKYEPNSRARKTTEPGCRFSINHEQTATENHIGYT